MQKTTLLLAVVLVFGTSSQVQDIRINGTRVSLEANETLIHTAKNPQAIALLPEDLHLAVPGEFTATVVALDSPPLTVFADDNRTLFGSETDIARLVAGGLGLEVSVVPTSWEDWSLGITSGKYDAAISNITVIKEHKEELDFAIYRRNSLGFYVRSTSLLNEIDKTEGIAGLKIIVGSGTSQEVILLVWNTESVKKGLKPFTPVYTKGDTTQTLALQTGRANAYSDLSVIDAWKAALIGKTRLVGSVDGGWPGAVHIAVVLRKDSGSVNVAQAALNGAIVSGDYAKALNHRGEGVEGIPQSEINPPGLGD